MSPFNPAAKTDISPFSTTKFEAGKVEEKLSDVNVKHMKDFFSFTTHADSVNVSVTFFTVNRRCKINKSHIHRLFE